MHTTANPINFNIGDAFMLVESQLKFSNREQTGDDLLLTEVEKFGPLREKCPSARQGAYPLRNRLAQNRT